MKQKNECGKFDLKKWGEEYRLKNADKLKIKRDERFKADPKKMNVQKLLFNLNSCNTSRPRESTIKFYDLKKDAATGKWYVEK